jgi:hypothetical protein
MKVILAVSGYAQSGKDTFADAVVESIGSKHACSRFKFAEDLRIATRKAFEHLEVNVNPWTEDKSEKEQLRPVLVAIGEYARSKNENVFAELTSKNINRSLSSSCEIAIVTDMRYSNEHEILKRLASDKGYTYHRIHVTRIGNGPVNEAEDRSVAKLLQYPVDASYIAKNGDVGALRMVSNDYIRTFILPYVK